MSKAINRAVKASKDVYRGYMPIDLPQNRPPNRIKPWWKVEGKPRVTVYPRPEDDLGFTNEPQYPPLNDPSMEGLRRKVRTDWYDTLTNLPTTEQKLAEVNKQCMHYIAHINNFLPRCNSLAMAQYMTQTHIINSLPKSYQLDSSMDETNSESGNNNQLSSDLIDKLERQILDQIALNKYESIRKLPRQFISKVVRDGNERAFESNSFIQNIVNQVRRTVAADVNPQLLDYQMDLSPAIRSWWYHSGFPAPNNKPYYRSRKDKDGNISQIIQMDGSAALNLRSDSLLEPIVQLDDPLVTDTSLIEDYCYSLHHFGAHHKFKWPVMLPGFWFEDTPKYDCPHTAFLSTDCLRLRNKLWSNMAKPLEDVENSLNSQAVLTAFGWLNSLASSHGYTPFQEIDYPLTSQVVTTDGQNWLFNVYQLNTHSFHRDLGGRTRNNICWSSGIMKLYESYEHGAFKGLNKDVLNLIARFMSQQTSPAYTESLNLRPHLGTDIRTSDEKDQTKRQLRRTLEGRINKWEAKEWFVPMFEHIFFRSEPFRNTITHMKARWHIPKPKTPKMFE